MNLSTQKFYATPWQKGMIVGAENSIPAFFGRPGSTDPNQSEYRGGIWPGELLEVIAVSLGQKDVDGNPIRGTKWVLVIRRDEDGKGVKLWVPYENRGMKISPTTMVRSCIDIDSSIFKISGDLRVSVSIFDQSIKSEPDGSANDVLALRNGDIIHVLDEIDNGDKFVSVLYTDNFGKECVGYFDTYIPCPFEFKTSTWYPTLLKCGFNWKDVPVYKEEIPEPEKEKTIWQKIWEWVVSVWNKIFSPKE